MISKALPVVTPVPTAPGPAEAEQTPAPGALTHVALREAGGELDAWWLGTETEGVWVRSQALAQSLGPLLG